MTKTYLNITNKGVPMESSNNLKQNNISNKNYNNTALFTIVNMHVKYECVLVSESHSTYNVPYTIK